MKLWGYCVNCKVYVFNTRKLNFSNWCYIIHNVETSAGVFIDPAWEAHTLDNSVAQYGLKPKAVFLTHSHIDHANLAHYIATRYKTDVYISKQEAKYYGFQCKNLHTLTHMQRVNVSGIYVNCYLTPGHTAGSMCYQIDENLFTGDTLFYEGCGWCGVHGGSPMEMYKSIQFIKHHFSDRVRVYPGHVYGQAVGQCLEALKRENIYCCLENAEEFITYRTRKGQCDLFNFR